MYVIGHAHSHLTPDATGLLSASVLAGFSNEVFPTDLIGPLRNSAEEAVLLTPLYPIGYTLTGDMGNAGSNAPTLPHLEQGLESQSSTYEMSARITRLQGILGCNSLNLCS